MSTEAPMHALFSADRLTMLMARTGTGESISTRALATAAGVSHGTIGNLTSGTQLLVPEEKAKRIAAAIGVDLLVLFVPMERAGRVFIPVQKALVA